MKKDIGTRLALAGLGAAISLIFVTLAYFIKNLSLSFTVLSAVGIMFPLTKKYYREALLSSIVVFVIGFFIANLSIIPFAMVSSFYVVFTIFCYNKNFNKIIILIIKIAYSLVVFFILYYLINEIVVSIDKIIFFGSLPPWALYVIVNILFTLAFVAYDYLLIKGYEYLKNLLFGAKKGK